MVTFQQVPPLKLDVKTGVLSDSTGAPIEPKAEPASIGIPTPDFHQQVMSLAQSGIPLDKAFKAIDAHEGITDKQTAKGMAQAVYQIVKPGKA